MTEANARLSTSVTANWRVKPTAEIASTAEVIRPNPIEASSRLTRSPACPPARGSQMLGAPGCAIPAANRSRSDRSQLRGCDVARHDDRAGRAVGVDLEDA